MKRELVYRLLPIFVFFAVNFFTLSTTFAQIYVGNSGANSIPSYGINATGNVAPLTNIQGAATTLNSPAGVAVDATWIYVGNWGNNSVAVWPINATGNVAPTRSIQGAATTLNNPRGIAVLGGAPRPPAPVPTMNEWGMIIFIVLMALVSLVYLKKGRHYGRHKN